MAVDVRLSDGAFVIVFQTATGVFFERLDASAQPAGSPVLVASVATQWVSATTLANGGFSVVWDVGSGLVAQDFSGAGSATGGVYSVVTPPAPALLAFTSDAQTLSADAKTATAILSDGGSVKAVVVATPSGIYELRVQQFDFHGGAVGPEHIASANAGETMVRPTVAMLADGSYKVGYGAQGGVDALTYHEDYYVQNYTVAGAFTGQVHWAHGFGGVLNPISNAAMIGLPDGGFVVSMTQDTGNQFASGISFGEYAIDGTLKPDAGGLGSTDAGHTAVRFEALSDGRYVASWMQNGVFNQQIRMESQATLNRNNDSIATGAGSFSMPNGPHNLVLAGGALRDATGNALDNRIESTTGLGATIRGGQGDDTTIAGAGANYLRGDEGDDSIAGGAGFDDANGNMGNDTVSTGAGDDWAVGGKDNDLLSGDAGSDVVWGNLGNDTCHGGDGNDQVRGGQGDDSVSGGAGDDYVSGDRGNDTISGGMGADLFHGSQDAGIDRVLDFHSTEGDRVVFDPGTTYTLSQIGADTVIDMGGGHQMILVGVQLSALAPGWIFGA